MEQEIIDGVLLDMMSEINSEALSALKQALRAHLSKYEIKERETSLVCLDNNGFNWLQKFGMYLTSAGRSPRTIEQYDGHIRRFLSYLCKNVEDITDNDVVDYIDKYRRVRKVSNGYLNDIRLAFRSFFKFLVNRKVIPSNPADAMDSIKEKKKVKKPFTPSEMVKIRESATEMGLREKAMVEFLYSTGVRVSELAALNKEDISWEDNEVIVLGKGNKERYVYLNASSTIYLREYLESRTDNEDALFVSKRVPFQRLKKAGIEDVCRKIGKNSDVENVHPHRFRRTVATELLNMGMPIEQVQDVLGHTKIETTRIYCSVNREQVKQNHKRFMSA